MSDDLDAALEQQGIGQPDAPGRPRMEYSLNSIAMGAPDNVVEHWHGFFWSDQHKFFGISTVRGRLLASMPKHWPDVATADFVCVSLRHSGLFDHRFANVKLSYTPPTYLHCNNARIRTREVVNGCWTEHDCCTGNIVFGISSRTHTEMTGTYAMGNDNGTFKLSRF